MKYTVLKDICEDIKRGDQVAIIPSYSYMIGEDNVRIKDYFKLQPGEVVVSKYTTFEEGNIKERMSLAKCMKSSLAEIKEK